MAKKQREIFLTTEGDEYFKRNEKYNPDEFVKDDPVCKSIEDIAKHMNVKAAVVEVGCSDGRRLKALGEKYDWKYQGVEPSTDALQKGKSYDIDILKGSAEELPIKDKSVDILIYGFCLYLCDREELFKICAEGNRVTKDKSWIIIHDFWAKADIANDYHHRAGIKSYKTRPEEMFSWHPNFTLMDARIRDISSHNYTDNPDNWVQTSVLRKFVEEES